MDASGIAVGDLHRRRLSQLRLADHGPGGVPRLPAHVGTVRAAGPLSRRALPAMRRRRCGRNGSPDRSGRNIDLGRPIARGPGPASRPRARGPPRNGRRRGASPCRGDGRWSRAPGGGSMTTHRDRRDAPRGRRTFRVRGAGHWLAPGALGRAPGVRLLANRPAGRNGHDRLRSRLAHDRRGSSRRHWYRRPRWPTSCRRLGLGGGSARHRRCGRDLFARFRQPSGNLPAVPHSHSRGRQRGAAPAARTVCAADQAAGTPSTCAAPGATSGRSSSFRCTSNGGVCSSGARRRAGSADTVTRRHTKPILFLRRTVPVRCAAVAGTITTGSVRAVSG